MKDERQDGWQRQAVGFLAMQEDFRDIAKHPQRHHGIHGALVLEQEVKQRFSPAKLGGKQQIRMDLLQVGFDKRCGQHLQRRPVHPRCNSGRQIALEKRRGVFGLREDFFEKRIVRETCWLETVIGFFHDAG